MGAMIDAGSIFADPSSSRTGKLDDLEQAMQSVLRRRNISSEMFFISYEELLLPAWVESDPILMLTLDSLSMGRLRVCTYSFVVIGLREELQKGWESKLVSRNFRKSLVMGRPVEYLNP